MAPSVDGKQFRDALYKLLVEQTDAGIAEQLNRFRSQATGIRNDLLGVKVTMADEPRETTTMEAEHIRFLRTQGNAFQDWGEFFREMTELAIWVKDRMDDGAREPKEEPSLDEQRRMVALDMALRYIGYYTEDVDLIDVATKFDNWLETGEKA